MHATQLAAINAARKQFGANYRDFVNIEKIGLREFSIQHRPIPQAEGIALETEREGEFQFPTFQGNQEAKALWKEGYEAEQRAKAFFASLPKPMDSDEIQFRDLDSDEESEFRQWARDNFKAGDEISLAWHPAVQDECALIDAEAQADRIANAAASEERLPNGKIYIRMSSIPKPTKQVWHIADAMILAAKQQGLPRPSRQEIQDECIRQGIATGTARTQYQAWKKANDATLANQEAAEAASKRFNS
jgi:hypothetical protein